MTFLNPLVLWLLPLISIPVIIHLLAKRRSRIVDFPSLKFLKLLEQDALRKFNLKQLILLIIRTLMVLLLILIFSKPLINSWTGGGFGLIRSHLALIVVDNTASTRDIFSDISGPWITELAETLRSKGYTVWFTSSEDFRLVQDPGDIRSGWAAIFKGDVYTRLQEQIDLAGYADHVLIWIGDNQDVHHGLQALADWDTYHLAPEQGSDNALTSIKLPAQGLQIGQDLTLDLGLSFVGDDTESIPLELFVNEERRNQRVIESGESNVSMTIQVKEAGNQLGQVQLSEDRYPFNDARFFVIPAQGQIPFQVLREQTRLDYWAIMGKAIGQEYENMDYRLIHSDQVADLDLSRGGTVLIENAADIADYTWGRLEAFLEKGGQLIVFGASPNLYQRILNWQIEPALESTQINFALRLTDQGARASLPAPLTPVLDEGRMKIYQRFETGGNELGSTWIRYADEQPFLAATNFGAGRVIWFNTNFGGTGSNLAQLGIFPTLLMHFGQSIESQEQVSKYNYQIGDTIVFQPETSPGSESYLISRPDGTTDYVSPDENYEINYQNTDLPGIYSLNRGRQILQPVAVNIEPAEARLLDRPRVDDGRDGFYTTSSAKDLSEEIVKSRTGIILWPLMLVILISLFILESYLSRIKRTWRNNA